MEAAPQTPEMVTAERSVMQGRKQTESPGAPEERSYTGSLASVLCRRGGNCRASQ